jgi:8-oxo-dGTP diphosphatase
MARDEPARDDRVAMTVGALLINADGRVLLGLRAPSKRVWPVHWDTIGGRVEPGESLEQALIREVEEEIGVTPTEFRFVAAVPERQPERYGAALHHVYAVTRWRGDPANASYEHTEIRWFTIAGIRRLANIVDSNYARFARQAVSGRKKSGHDLR